MSNTREELAKDLHNHINGMMDSLDESVTHEQIYAQLKTAWNLSRTLVDLDKKPSERIAFTGQTFQVVSGMFRGSADEVVLSQCLKCGALVGDTNEHAKWHNNLHGIVGKILEYLKENADA